MLRASLALASLLVLVGCPPPPPEDVPETPPATDEDLGPEGMGEAVAEAVETGKDCTTAEVLCDGGVCTATIKNACEAPVTCALDMMAVCQGETDMGEARGKGRDTIAAGVTFELQAGANCQGDRVIATQVDSLSCK